MPLPTLDGINARRSALNRASHASARLATSLAVATATLVWGLAPAVQAGGLYVNEFSTTSQANAGAGRGAWVPDASASLHNPAAMTRLDDHGLATGFSLATGSVRFDPASDSPSGTQSGGNQAGLAPIASLSYVHRVSERIRVGLNFFSVSGNVLDPSDDWAGRFEMTDLSLLTISIAPAIAIELTDWLSIGGGPIATYGLLDWNLTVPVSGFEREVQLDSFDDWEPAGRVGLHLHPHERLDLSLTYLSKTDFNLDGRFKAPIGLSADVDLELPLAQTIEASAAWRATDRWTLLATFNWEDWSEADDLKVTLNAVTVGASTGMQDTYKIGFGANYQLDDDWLLQAGFMFDTSALNANDRTVALPIDEQIRVAVGFQHALGETLSLGGSFVYVNLGQNEVRNASVRGDYRNNDLFALGVTLSFGKLPWSGRLTR